MEGKDFIQDVSRPLEHVHYSLIGDKIDFCQKEYKYINTYNVPCRQLIEDLGITLEYREEETSERGYHDFKEKKIVICNPKQHTKEEIEYTLSHELAHFFLHQTALFREQPLSHNGNQHFVDGSNIEKEADIFALRLLINRDLLIKELRKDNVMLDELAEKFNTTPYIMGKRLEIIHLEGSFIEGDDEEEYMSEEEFEKYFGEFF